MNCTSSKLWTRSASSLLLALCVLLPAVAQAQDKGDKPVATNEKENKKVRPLEVRKSFGKTEIVISKVDGWVIGKAPKGAVALFRLAGEKSNSQIEVRLTPEIKEKDSGRHFQTLHTNLRRRGLKRVGEPKSVKLSEAIGEAVETEYSLTSGGKPYKLVFWHFYHPTGVWFISGFFPEADRARRYVSMQQVAQKIAFESKK